MKACTLFRVDDEPVHGAVVPSRCFWADTGPADAGVRHQRTHSDLTGSPSLAIFRDQKSYLTTGRSGCDIPEWHFTLGLAEPPTGFDRSSLGLLRYSPGTTVSWSARNLTGSGATRRRGAVPLAKSRPGATKFLVNGDSYEHF